MSENRFAHLMLAPAGVWLLLLFAVPLGIAAALYLSPNSIKTYVRTAYRKNGASSRSQAVGWAIRNGFPVDGPGNQ